jgi:hypothetical protein
MVCEFNGVNLGRCEPWLYSGNHDDAGVQQRGKNSILGSVIFMMAAKGLALPQLPKTKWIAGIDRFTPLNSQTI